MSQHPATEFLHALDPASDATFHITTLTDLPKGKRSRRPTRCYAIMRTRPLQRLKF